MATLSSLPFSEREAQRRAPERASVRAATKAFREDGAVVLENAFDLELLARCKEAFVAEYAGLSVEELTTLGGRVGDERYMLSLWVKPPFSEPAIYANPLVLPVLEALLGEDLILSSFAAVTSFPGAGPQHVHRDHPYLFPEHERLSLELPTYAVTLAVPLLDLDAARGGTRIWGKTHNRRSSALRRIFTGERVRIPAGACYLMDYRLVHGGEGNDSALPRPVLYIAYSRPWFRDSANFRGHPPIRISPAERARVPQAHQGLFMLADAPHLA